MISTIRLLKDTLLKADKILVGAGAGLSTSAGFEYGGSAFMRNFSYMFERYGYTDMYSAGFHPFENEREKWWYWSNFIFLNRYATGAMPLYEELFSLLKQKDYFVLTTNVDHQFQKAGFDKKRLFYTQGDYGLFQCEEPCHKQAYDNEEIVRKMIAGSRDHKIPEELIPRCPRCGRKMTINLRADNRFVEDEGWKMACRRYKEFLRGMEGRRCLLLELGVGYNTPGIIKYPFWGMTNENPDFTYACLNMDEPYVPKEIRSKSLLIQGDIKESIETLLSL